MSEQDRPHLGITRTGQPVHRRAVDHLPGRTVADRINKWLAVKITSGVGTMWCAYLFCCISLSSLPSTLALHSVNADVQWVAQTFLQLVLLSVIIVGQNIASAAGDVRNEHMLDLVTVTADAVNLDTAGGLAKVLGELRDLRGEVRAMARHRTDAE